MKTNPKTVCIEKNDLTAQRVSPPCPASTMSVVEMGKLLGLKKTDSYYLANKGYFRIFVLNGKMRVSIRSFEQWYANQLHYVKVNGPPPGENVCNRSISVAELMKLLALSETSVRKIIADNDLPTESAGTQIRVFKDAFYQWYSGQAKYRLPEDRAQDEILIRESISMPEMGRLLGLHRNIVYSILSAKENQGKFEIITVAGQKRITTVSFLNWLNNQKQFKLKVPMKPVPPPPLPKKPPKQSANPDFYTISEASAKSGLSRQAIMAAVSRNAFSYVKSGKYIRITKQAFDLWLQSRANEQKGAL